MVAVLRRVPAKRLAIFELAAELLDGEGDVDLDAVASRQPEVNLAVAEVQTHTRATRQAVEAIRRLPAR